VSEDLRPRRPSRRDGKQRRPQGRSPRPPKRREELLARAAKAFRDKGFEASTTQDIADSLGILRGSLYYYIESKDDLLFEIVEDFHRRTLRIWELARQTDGDTLVRLRAFITAYVVHVIDNPVEAAVFFRDFRSLSPARQRRLVKERDEYWNELRELVIQGQREEVICPDVDITVIQHGILGMVNFLSLYAPTAKIGSRISPRSTRTSSSPACAAPRPRIGPAIAPRPDRFRPASSTTCAAGWPPRPASRATVIAAGAERHERLGCVPLAERRRASLRLKLGLVLGEGKSDGVLKATASVTGSRRSRVFRLDARGSQRRRRSRSTARWLVRRDHSGSRSSPGRLRRPPSS